MLANVSFGILAFHPIGWILMLLVVALEAILLSVRLGPARGKLGFFAISSIANAVSGSIGILVSIAMNGGWWLVVWVPWVTANEASPEQWPELIAFMAVAFVGSVALESAVSTPALPGCSFKEVVTSQAIVNLVSSTILLAVFWAMGGVPWS